MSDKSFREYSFEALVIEKDPDHYKHDEVIYKFSNGRKFFIDDHITAENQGGVYSYVPEGSVFWDGNMEGMEWDENGDPVIWDGSVPDDL